jgi:voltage-gated potassium channel
MTIYRVFESRTGRLRYRMFLRQVGRILVMLLAVQAICAAGLFLLDGSALPDDDKLFNAVWNAANAVTTLGDFTDLSQGQKVFMMVAMFSLITVGGYAITTLTGILTSPDVISFRENRRVARMLADLKDHIIIVGFSRVGQLLAERIVKEGARVVVIDRNTEVAADASNRGYLVVQGAANEEQTLQRAEIGRARALLLTTEDTSHRLSVTVMARAMNPDIYLLTIGLSEPGRDWLEHAGASEVVQVDRVVADSLHERLSRKIKLA